MDLNQTKKALEIIIRSIDSINNGNYEEAKRFLETANSISPNNYLAYYLLGEIKLLNNDFKNSFFDFFAARKTSENNTIESAIRAAKAAHEFFEDAEYNEYKNIVDNYRLPKNFELQLRNALSHYEMVGHKHAETLIKDKVKWFNQHAKKLNELGFVLKGKHVLEIGSGVIPVICMLYLCSGCKVKSVDKYRSPYNFDIIGPSMQKICYTDILEKIHHGALDKDLYKDFMKLNTEDIIEVSDNNLKIINPNYEFCKGIDSASTGFEDNTFDLITSNVTLEHVGDPDGDPDDTIKEISRILKPGGYTAHIIGINDHRDPDNAPYDCLRFSKDEWLNYECPHNQRINRWRITHFRESFEKAGLEEVYIETNTLRDYPPLTDEIYNSFHSDFKSLPREDLEVLDFFVVLRKPL